MQVFIDLTEERENSVNATSNICEPSLTTLSEPSDLFIDLTDESENSVSATNQTCEPSLKTCCEQLDFTLAGITTVFMIYCSIINTNTSPCKLFLSILNTDPLEIDFTS